MAVSAEIIFPAPTADLSELTELTAVTSVDGRYGEITKPLRPYFSEYALIRARVMVEMKYLQALSANGVIRPMSPEDTATLDGIWLNFSLADAGRVKEIEGRTRHDVKAMTYFLEETLGGQQVADLTELVHFGLTSEDVSNLAQNVLIKEAKRRVIVPSLWDVVDALSAKAIEWKDTAILARTHGREALPTTMGKEMALYAHRLAVKIQGLSRMNLTGKLNGATGNFHELGFAEPDTDWIKFSGDFISSFGLEPILFTTQIEPHDRWAEVFDELAETMVILNSADQNIWGYIAQDYFFLQPRAGQIGSSVMPHKGRNPIGLENSEGNSFMATMMLYGLAGEMPNSRFQRHLSDTTMSRNIGSAFALSLIAAANSVSDIEGLALRQEMIDADVNNRWGLVTAAIQTRLRRLGITNAYEAFDAMAKAGPITQERLHAYIDSLPIAEEERAKMKALRSEKHIGYAPRLTEMMLDEIRQMKASES